jgi:hypothetical protein
VGGGAAGNEGESDMSNEANWTSSAWWDKNFPSDVRYAVDATDEAGKVGFTTRAQARSYVKIWGGKILRRSVARPAKKLAKRKMVETWAFLIVWHTQTPSPVACETKREAEERRRMFLRGAKDCGPITRIQLPAPTAAKKGK